MNHLLVQKFTLQRSYLLIRFNKTKVFLQIMNNKCCLHFLKYALVRPSFLEQPPILPTPPFLWISEPLFFFGKSQKLKSLYNDGRRGFNYDLCTHTSTYIDVCACVHKQIQTSKKSTIGKFRKTDWINLMHQTTNTKFKTYIKTPSKTTFQTGTSWLICMADWIGFCFAACVWGKKFSNRLWNYVTSLIFVFKNISCYLFLTYIWTTYVIYLYLII